MSLQTPDYAPLDPNIMSPLRRWWPVLLAFPIPAIWAILAVPHHFLHPFRGVLWVVAIVGTPIFNGIGQALGCLPARRWTWAGAIIIGFNAVSLLICAAGLGLLWLCWGIGAP
jgi:hypothetical protein